MQNQGIVGSWKVVDADVLPFDHMSFCKNLDAGSTYEFTSDSVLHIYDDSSTLCTSSMKYHLGPQELSIQEGDMIAIHPVNQNIKDTLSIKIFQVPDYLYAAPKDGDELQVTVQYIQQKGNTITLKKMNE